MSDNLNTQSAPVHTVDCVNGLLTLLPQQGYEVCYQASSHTIGFAFDDQVGEHAYASDRICPFLAKPNSLAFVPQGCDVYSRSQRGGEYLVLSLDNPQLNGVQFNNIQDVDTRNIAFCLRRILLSGQPICELEMEYLTRQLMERVEYILLGRPESSNTAWMTDRRFTLIEALVEDHLDQKLTVKMLADYLQLSEGFFHRTFKAAVGQSLHEFIIQRRLSRARKLLQHTTYSLADIAQQVGFASHAHMTAAFSRRLGVSPSALRYSS